MIDYELKDNKKLRVYEYYDMVLVYIHPHSGRVYYSFSDDEMIHCVVARNYAHVFSGRQEALDQALIIAKKFGIEFMVERL